MDDFIGFVGVEAERRAHVSDGTPKYPCRPSRSCPTARDARRAERITNDVELVKHGDLLSVIYHMLRTSGCCEFHGRLSLDFRSACIPA